MRPKTLLPLAAALLLAFVPYRAFFGPAVPLARDLPFYFYPLKAHLAEAVRAGEMPWIDRFRWGGSPLLGAPGAAPFDPLNVLFVLLPLGTAMKAWMLARLAAGVAGFALFARRRGASPEGASLAGLVFGLSGLFGSFLAFPGASAGYSLLPWLAVAVERALERPCARRAAALALAAGLILVCGAPEFVLYGSLLGLLRLPASMRRALAGRQLATLLAAAFLAAGLAAPAILTGVRAGARSTRGPGGGLNLRASSEGSLAPARLPELVRDGAVADWRVSQGLPDVPYPYLPSITPGAVGLVLLAAGLLAGRAALAPLSLSALGVMLALGPATPVWPALARVFPPLLAIRYPEKHLALFGFGAAWLAALGIARLEPLLRGRLRQAALAALAFALLLEREPMSRGLVLLDDPSWLSERPALLASVPPAPFGAPPPRLFPLLSYRGYPARKIDLVPMLHATLASLDPEFGSLHGAGYLFERDYDLLLPRQSFEWERLLHEAVPAGGPLVGRLLRTTGIAFVPEIDARAGRPRLLRLSDPLPPYRFARRVVADPDGRRLLRRTFDEAFDPATAYIAAPRTPIPNALSPGRVLAVRDRPGALALSVEASGPAPSFLMLYRRLDALEEATLDGRPLPVVDVLFGFGGVFVPPGRHELRLRPETGSVRIGALMTLLSAAAIAALASRSPCESACP